MPVWTNVYGAARSILALGTLLTLAFNPIDLIFRPIGIMPEANGDSIARFGLFALAGPSALDLAHRFAIAVLALVIVGWRPRITGVLHWWVTASFAASCIPVEGGDQIASIITLLLIPVTLTDDRRNHWSEAKAPMRPATLWAEMRRVIALSALQMIRLQVAVIYFFACVSKFAVIEWTNGTALYYWMVHPTFGLADPIRPFAVSLLSSAPVVIGLTWSVLTLEACLFSGLFMDARFRKWVFAAGIAFHFGIVVVHGLLTFFLAMAGALILYLQDTSTPYRLRLPTPSATLTARWFAWFSARRAKEWWWSPA